LNDKVPQNQLTPFSTLKERWRAKMRIPNVWNPSNSNHRYCRHCQNLFNSQQVGNDNTNDGIPLISENTVQNLMLNLLPAMFTSYPELSPLGWW